VKLSRSALSLHDGRHWNLITHSQTRLVTTVILLREGHSSSTPAVGGCFDFILLKSIFLELILGCQTFVGVR